MNLCLPLFKKISKNIYISSLLLLLLFSLISLVIYHQGLKNGFVRDDTFFICSEYVDNSPSNIFKYFTSPLGLYPKSSGYRPLVQASFIFNNWLGGEQPYGYHLFNILLHSLNALLIFWVALHLWQLLKLDKFFANRLALFTALLFLIHPLNSQVVLYVHARTCSLYTFFYLLSFLLYSRKKFICSAVMFLCSMFSKETAVTLLPVLCCYEYFFIRPTFKNNFAWCKKLFLALLPVLIAFFFFLTIRHHIIGRALVNFTKLNLQKIHEAKTTPGKRNIFVNMLTQTCVTLHYLYLYLLPYSLNFELNFPLVKSIYDSKFIIAITVFLVAIVYNWKWASTLVRFCSLWFVCSLIVTFLIPLHVIVNEHRMYMATIALSIMFVYFCKKLLSKWPRLGSTIFVIIFFSMGIRGYYRSFAWKNEITIYTADQENLSLRMLYSLADRIRNSQPRKALQIYNKLLNKKYRIEDITMFMGLAYMKLGEYKQAEHFLHKAKIKINPQKVMKLIMLHYHQAELYTRQGKFKKAEAILQQTLLIKIKQGWAIFRDGDIILKTKTIKKRKWFERKCSQKVINALTWYNLAHLYRQQKKYPAAFYAIKQGLKNYRKFIGLHTFLGFMCEEIGNISQARLHFANALQLYLQAKNNYSVLGCLNIVQCAYKAKQSHLLIPFLKKQLQQKHHNATLYTALGCAYLSQNEVFLAISCFKKALQLEPFAITAHQNLLSIYQTLGDKKLAWHHKKVLKTITKKK